MGLSPILLKQMGPTQINPNKWVYAHFYPTNGLGPNSTLSNRPESKSTQIRKKRFYFIVVPRAEKAKLEDSAMIVKGSLEFIVCIIVIDDLEKASTS